MAFIPSALNDGTNTSNILKSDGTAAGQNSQLVAGTGYSTGTLTLNLASQATQWFDLLNYPSLSFEVLTNSSAATLTFQTSGDASETNITNTVMMPSTSLTSGVTTSTTTATQTFYGSRTGRYFRISSNVSGANTVTLNLNFFTTSGPLMAAGGIVSQSGAWSMGSSTATGSAFPANAFGVGVSDGTNLVPLRTGVGSDGFAASVVLSTTAQLFNGSNYDRIRNNEAVTLLVSAARTTTQTSADLVNYNGKSALIVTLDMTVVGTGSVTLSINRKDSVSGKYINILTGAAITTNSTNVYKVGPDIPAVANAIAQDYLGRTFQIVVTANNANSATYSVGYELVRG